VPDNSEGWDHNVNQIYPERVEKKNGGRDDVKTRLEGPARIFQRYLGVLNGNSVRTEAGDSSAARRQLVGRVLGKRSSRARTMKTGLHSKFY